MKMEKAVKILSIVLMVMIIASVAVPVFATATIPTPDTGGETTTKLNTVAGRILGIVQAIGIAIAVAMLIIVGVKYITASPDGKAEYKKTAIAYVVGAVLLFAASGVLAIIQNFATDVVNTVA